MVFSTERGLPLVEVVHVNPGTEYSLDSDPRWRYTIRR